MGVRLSPKTIAQGIAPGTYIPYEYICGEDISTKYLVCKSEMDAKVYLARADTWDRMPCFGIAIQSKSEGQTIQVVPLGTFTNVARAEDWDYDDSIYVSTTAGEATKYPPEGDGEIAQLVGRALSASSLIFSPILRGIEIDIA